MTPDKFFSDIVDIRLAICKNIMKESKNVEYTRNNDKFHNFKVAAREDNITPERALRGMWLKHIVSIKDIIDDIDHGVLPTQKILDEKITDNINYLLLLEGLIKERMADSSIDDIGKEVETPDVIGGISHCPYNNF